MDALRQADRSDTNAKGLGTDCFREAGEVDDGSAWGAWLF